MKILHVFSMFNLKYGGGTCDLIYKLAKEQSKKHSVTILTSDYLFDSEYANSLKDVSFEVCKSVFSFLPFRVQVHSLISIFNFTPALIAFSHYFLKEFDVIHLHSQRSIMNIIIVYYARKYGVPYVIDAHGSSPYNGRALIKKTYDKFVSYKDCSRFIAESPIGIQEYKSIGVSENRITKIQPSLDIEEFEDLPQKGLFREKYGIKETYILTFVGRINYIKGLDFLVEAFAQLKLDAKLVIVGGDDGYLYELTQLIEKLGIQNRVLFTGFLQGKDKLSAFVDSDIVIQPSRYEQGAWMPFEAVLCGTPIIVTNTGAGDDVKRIHAGSVVEFGNKDELVSTIKGILYNYSLVILWTIEAKRWLKENLSIQKNVENYEQVYDEVIKK